LAVNSFHQLMREFHFLRINLASPSRVFAIKTDNQSIENAGYWDLQPFAYRRVNKIPPVLSLSVCSFVAMWICIAQSDFNRFHPIESVVHVPSNVFTTLYSLCLCACNAEWKQAKTMKKRINTIFFWQHHSTTIHWSTSMTLHFRFWKRLCRRRTAIGIYCLTFQAYRLEMLPDLQELWTLSHFFQDWPYF